MKPRRSLIMGSRKWPLCDASDNAQTTVIDRANFRTMFDMARISRCYLPDAYDLKPGREVADEVDGALPTEGA